jgi:hypothetical protein
MSATGANNVLQPTPVIMGNAALDAATSTDAAGTLAVIGTATINLDTGATFAFANSSAVDWTGGTLILTGDFVPGSSLRFGSGACFKRSSAFAMRGLHRFTLIWRGAFPANGTLRHHVFRHAIITLFRIRDS